MSFRGIFSGRIFRERPLSTTQRGQFLWEVEYDIAGLKYDPETGEGIEHRYASFVSDEERLDEEILDEALEKAEGNAYGDIIDVRIVEAWHARL